MREIEVEAGVGRRKADVETGAGRNRRLAPTQAADPRRGVDGAQAGKAQRRRLGQFVAQPHFQRFALADTQQRAGRAAVVGERARRLGGGSRQLQRRRRRVEREEAVRAGRRIDASALASLRQAHSPADIAAPRSTRRVEAIAGAAFDNVPFRDRRGGPELAAASSRPPERLGVGSGSARGAFAWASSFPSSARSSAWPVGLAASPHVIEDGVGRATLLTLAGGIFTIALAVYIRD